MSQLLPRPTPPSEPGMYYYADNETNGVAIVYVRAVKDASLGLHGEIINSTLPSRWGPVSPAGRIFTGTWWGPLPDPAVSGVTTGHNGTIWVMED